MTIAKAQVGQQVAVASSKLPDVSRPVTLPTALSEMKAVEGFRNPQWQARALAPSERVGTQQALVAIEARCRTATSHQIMWHIGKLLSHWDSNQNAVVKDQIMEDWKLDLAEESEAHIAEASAQWRRTQTFKPKIAEILAVIAGIKARDSESIRRARVLLGMEPPRFWEKPVLPASKLSQKTVTPGMWASLTAKLRSPAAPPPRQVENVTRSSAKDLRGQLAQDRDPEAVERLRNLTKTAEQA